MEKKKIFITNNFEATRSVGEKFSQNLLGGKIIALYGELGNGKTTFVQGLAKGLGIKKRILSPTFIIVRRYELNLKSKILNLKSKFKNLKSFYHLDLFRIQNQNDLEGLGMEEIMNNPQNIVVIEWAEKLGKLMPRKRIDIFFEYIDENKRKITIENLNSKS